MKIFESEFDFKTFMLQIANDYEKKYFRKAENYFYFIQNEEQLMAAAHAYKDYLDNANEKEYNAKIKKIFANSSVRQFKDEREETNSPERIYNKFEIFIMTVLAICAFGYAIFFAEVLTERVVLSMAGTFLLISPILVLKSHIVKKFHQNNKN